MFACRFDRRRFLAHGAAAAAGCWALAPRAVRSAILPAQEESDTELRGRVFKTLKIGMVNVPGSLADRFRAAKSAGSAQETQRTVVGSSEPGTEPPPTVENPSAR